MESLGKGTSKLSKRITRYGTLALAILSATLLLALFAAKGLDDFSVFVNRRFTYLGNILVALTIIFSGAWSIFLGYFARLSGSVLLTYPF